MSHERDAGVNVLGVNVSAPIRHATQARTVVDEVQSLRRSRLVLTPGPYYLMTL